MKRIISLLLALVMLVSVLSGCGGKQVEAVQAEPKTEGVMETTAAPNTEPATEPALSPEEMLYNSLSDRMRQAVDVGIVDLSQLEDLNRIVTVGEASAMLQKACVHRTGVESKALNDLMNSPEYADLTADRGWVLTIPGQTDMELSSGDKFENYKQWQDYLNSANPSAWWWGTEDLWYGFDDRLGIESFRLVDDDVVGRAYSVNAPQAMDEAEYLAMMGEDSIYGPAKPDSYLSAPGYGLKAYDSTTGKKFFELEDGCINPTMALTVADAVLLTRLLAE